MVISRGEVAWRIDGQTSNIQPICGYGRIYTMGQGHKYSRLINLLNLKIPPTESHRLGLQAKKAIQQFSQRHPLLFLSTGCQTFLILSHFNTAI